MVALWQDANKQWSGVKYVILDIVKNMIHKKWRMETASRNEVSYYSGVRGKGR